MSEEKPSNGRINISRDALRAELAEMELRLRIWIGEALEEKADMAVVADHSRLIADLQARVVYRDGPLSKTLESFREGEFTPAQARNITALVDSRMEHVRQESFDARARIFAWFTAVSTLLGIATGLLLVLHYAGVVR